MFASPPPLSEKVPTISPDVEQVVLTALEKDPGRRFKSVQAFATALELACQSASSRQGALPKEVTLPSEPSQPGETGTTLLPTRLPRSRNAGTPSSQSLRSTGTAIPSQASKVPHP